MSDRRLTPEELSELVGLPPDDPRRPAVDADPIRHAQLRAYEEFLDPGPLPPSARPDEAESRLLERVEQLTALSPPVAGKEPYRWFDWFRTPRLGPALAIAALLVVAVGVGTLLVPRGPQEEPILRGSGGPAEPGSWNAELRVELMSPGQTQLRWTAARGATDYTVVFLSSDLHEIARVPSHGAVGLMLEQDALPRGLVSGETVLWRVSASAGGDELARSNTSELVVP